jgi:excisionase family DNA binding protein
VKKNYFKTVVVGQKIRVMIDSFEDWYAKQFSYQKVDGTPPGEQLKNSLLSRAEIADLLEISVATVYEIEKKAKFDYVNIYGKQRILKESFDNWYRGKNWYKTQEDKKEEEILLSGTLSMPELARKTGIPRERVYALVNKGLFESVMVGKQKRITITSYETWLKTKATAGGK